MTTSSSVDSPPPTTLYIFTTSQTPLAIRFPKPPKPVLNIPPLVHRTLHTALDADPPSISVKLPPPHASSDFAAGATVYIPDPLTLAKHDLPSTSSSSSLSSQPLALDHSHSAPSDDPRPNPDLSRLATDEELTVKLHLVGSAPPPVRARWVSEALSVLEESKGLAGPDTLLLGWKGVDYKGRKTAASEMFGCGSEGLESGSGSEDVPPNVADEVEQTWQFVNEQILDRGQGGCADGCQSNGQSNGRTTHPRPKNVGTLYLPIGLLSRLADGPWTPAVNAMDTPDCHHLPKDYTDYARSKGIELWAGGGGEGADPLPDAYLHNLLNEFTTTLAPVIAPQHPLQSQIPPRADGLKWDDTAESGVAVRWVLGYSLVSSSRNTVTDKGYIVAAEIK